MTSWGRMGGVVVLTLVLGAGGAVAQDEIDFGDDSSRWALDGECDDPRFSGPGAASFQIPGDARRDASDCRAAYEAGTVTFSGEAGSAPLGPTEPPSSQPSVDEIDFGDDSSAWANDGECDDPRFTGPGGAASPQQADILADATDCRAAYEAGTVFFIIGEDIDFGDDSGVWARDGECDDPRFEGEGMGVADSDHLLADATDCRAAFEAGTVTYLGEFETLQDPLGDETGAGPVAGDIDFGDDSGVWARDGECDDPRFGGQGMGVADEDHLRADATDCREAYEAGLVHLLGDGEEDGDPIVLDGIDFGDDSGIWALDDECDDPRFGGQGMGVADEGHLLADATDCRAAYEAGTVYLLENIEQPDYPIVIDGIDFGDDSGVWSRDGECDDARFEGEGMGVASDSHRRADATDCSEAYLAGLVTLIEEQAPPTDSGFRINFGDDSSATALDGVCDDPRFQGRGASSELYDRNLMADATDCRAAHEAGTVTYVP